MWKIDNDLKIIMTRGDTPSFLVDLTDEDGTPYVPMDGDKIIWALKSSAKSPDLWAFIEIPTDTMILRLQESTTKALPFGEYVYEISLNNDAQGFHDTFICNKPLILAEELY